MAPFALALENIEKSYGGQALLRGASLQIAPGESVALFGRSGSGKSTLLRIAAGLENADAGAVQIAGINVSALRTHARTLHRRAHIGQVFQFFELFDTLSVLDNLLLPLRLNRMPLDLTDARALLASVGLAQHAQRFPDSLSGGEKQRLAVLRALIHRPALLLADEPTGSLDDANAQVVMQLLQQRAREHGVGLLIVTHARETAAFADRVLRVEAGLLVPA